MCSLNGANGSGGGNTDTPPVNKRANGCKNYCFTLNNYKLTDIDDIVLWCQTNCNKYVFGEEIGECGTPHLQGFFMLKKKMRITEFKNIVCLKLMHFEKCKGSEQDNINYCIKDGKIHYGGDIRIPDKVIIIKKLYEWQIQLEKILIDCTSDRLIYWIYEEKGGVGKTSFIKYMYDKYKCLLSAGGKKGDVINLVFNNKSYLLSRGKKIVLWNIPRVNKDGLSYSALEEIKDGIIVNYKFETGCFICNSPTICIFSNSVPNIEKLSIDRWRIYKIIDGKLKYININDICSCDEDN